MDCFVRFAAGFFLVLFLRMSCPLLAAAQTARIQHFPNPDKELLQQAQAAMDKKDYAAAAEAYRRYVADRPDDAYGHFQLGYAYTALDRHAEATAEYRKAVALDPSMAAAQMNLGLALLEKEPAAAVEPLRKAANLLPDQARPKFLLGWALERSGQLAPAIEQYELAEKIDFKTFDIHFALGRALLASQHAAEAEAEFRQALEGKPDSKASRLGLAESLLLQKKLEPAAEQLGEYLKSQPDDAENRLRRAQILADLGKYDDALAELDRAEATAPATLATLKLRADLCTELKQYPEAISALQKAVAQAPKDAELHARLGHELLEQRQYPPAAHEFGIAFQLDPRMTPALRNWISAQFMAENYSAALGGLDLFEKREAATDGTRFVRAVCYDKLGRDAEALDAYQKFLAQHAGTNDDQYFEASARARILKRESKSNRKK
jgi:tetratricopeptide (TPR) repeat protein